MNSALRVDTAARRLTIGRWAVPCMIGRGGACPAAVKREGDGRTPLGRWPIRGALIRRDRATPERPLQIPWRWIGPDDGWSDDALDPAYNRPVHVPHSFSHEHLWREDHAYDAIIVLGHNDAPPVPGMGSAIFLHQWVIGDSRLPRPTEGCIAISADDMRRLLPQLRAAMVMETA